YACEYVYNNLEVDQVCRRWIVDGEGWYAFVLAAIGISFVVCLVAMCWILCSCGLCCCRRHRLPLVFFSGFVSLLMLVAVIVYAVKHGPYVDRVTQEGKFVMGGNGGRIAQGFAVAAAILSTVCSVVIVRLGRHEHHHC
ncbi:hypothetical protein AAVH_34689, partial [Aphelenchoides avenae]